jgi:hypothetical protein
MKQKAETWQTCREISQTKGRNPKPGKFCPGSPKLRMESSLGCFYKKVNPLLDEVENLNLEKGL